MRASIFPGWWQVAVAVAVQAAAAPAIFNTFSILIAPFEHSFGASRTLVMLAITATGLVGGSLSPFAGTAMDRYSLRTLMLTGATLLSFGFFALSFTTSMIQVVVIYALLLAPAMSVMGPAAGSTLVARWFNRRRGLAMGIAASGTAIGGLILPPLLQWLIATFELRTGLRLFGGLLFVTTVPLIALFAIDRPAERNLHPDGDSEPVAVTAAEADHVRFRSTAAVLRNPNFWLLATLVGMVFAGKVALTTSLVPLVKEKGITAADGALLLSVFAAGDFGGKMLFAAIGDRIGARLALAAALALQMVGVFGFHADIYGMLVAASFLLGIAYGGVAPLWGFLVSRVFGPENVGRVMGLMVFVLMLFSLSTPLLFAFSFDKTGSYDTALIGYMAALVVAIVMVPSIRRYAPPLAAPAAG